VSSASYRRAGAPVGRWRPVSHRQTDA
jgi:hypothetical protein